MSKKVHRPRPLTAVIAAAATVTLAACGSDGGAEATGNGDENAGDPLEEVEIVLPTPPGIPHAPYFVAEELGYYEEEGLSVSLVNVTGGQDANRVVATGQGEFAFPAPSSVITAKQGGLPIVSVFGHRQDWIFGFAALEGSGIEEMEDLQGRSVGVISESAGNIARLMLVGAGIDPDAVDITVTGGDMAGPLASGNVDAIYSWTTLFEQYARQGLEQVWIDSPELERYQSNVLLTSEALVEESPDLVEGFLRGTVKGMVFTEENPRAALTILLEEMPNLREDEEAAMEELIIAVDESRSGLTEERGFGWQAEESWAQQQDALLELELIESRIDPADYWTNEFIQAANDFDLEAVLTDAQQYDG